MCAQSMALGTHTKFQLEILIRSTISAIHKFRENILESSRNISETTPWWHQAITWTDIDFSPVRTIDIHLRAVSQEIIINIYNYHEFYLLIIFLKFPSNLPGANELNMEWKMKVNCCHISLCSGVSREHVYRVESGSLSTVGGATGNPSASVPGPVEGA